MNGTWGFGILDQNYKSVQQLIHTMVRAAGNGANFLLNTGPMPNGKIQPENVDTLMAIGQWLEVYGESVYGTRSGPVAPGDWGASTKKGNLVYLHILDRESEKLSFPDFPLKVKSARLLEDGSQVTYKQNKQGLTVMVPAWKPGAFDNIVVLELK
jgi:alpha-L-fucosidase